MSRHTATHNPTLTSQAADAASLGIVSAARRIIEALIRAAGQLAATYEAEDPLANAESALALHGRWSTIYDRHPLSGKGAR
jgi:hypothetical protein